MINGAETIRINAAAPVDAVSRIGGTRGWSNDDVDLGATSFAHATNPGASGVHSGQSRIVQQCPAVMPASGT
jgi:hypothetical protein